MKKLVMLIFGSVALCLMSCLMVVHEDDGCRGSNDDADTVTIIFSKTDAGPAPVNPLGR